MHNDTGGSLHTERIISIYAAAGFATAPQFMRVFLERIALKLSQVSTVKQAKLLFPYGDWERSKMRQLREIVHDLHLSLGRRERSIGGGRIVAEIVKDLDSPADAVDEILIVGHSAGGIAAIHAVQMMEQMSRDDNARKQRRPTLKVASIGSPKCRVHEDVLQHSLYLYAMNTAGRVIDPITRIGSWGGWTKRRKSSLLWDPSKYAPGSVTGIPMIGGHKDYFRDHPTFVSETGCTNLDITTQAIIAWMKNQK